MKALLFFNLVVALAFGGLLIRAQWFTDLDVRGRYTALDRAGVIDEEALAAFDEGMARDDRNLVPRWIAGPALSGERNNATVGFLVAVANYAAVAFLNWRKRAQSVRVNGVGPGRGGPTTPEE